MMRWIPAGLAAAFVFGFTVFGGQAQPVMAVTQPMPTSSAAMEYLLFEGEGFSLELPDTFGTPVTQDQALCFTDPVSGIICTLRSEPRAAGFSLQAAIEAIPFQYGDVTAQSDSRLVKVGTGRTGDGLMALIAVEGDRVVELTFSFDVTRLDACQSAFSRASETLTFA